MGSNYPEGGFQDWIENLTDENIRQHLMCHLCGTYITGTYWSINGEDLCDDCARMLYQRGVNELDYEI